jgi:hypothetical protein
VDIDKCLKKVMHELLSRALTQKEKEVCPVVLV